MTIGKAKYRGWGDAPAEDEQETEAPAAGATMRALRGLATSPPPTVIAQSPTETKEEPSQPPVSTVSDTRLTRNTSLAPNTSLVSKPDYAPRGTRLTSDTRLTSNTTHNPRVDMWASIDDLHTGRLQLFNVIVDSIFAHLNPFEQAVYVQLYRLSWGYGKDVCRVSLPRLAERAGMKQTAAQQALKRLYEKGLIEKVVTVLGRGKEQGSEFRVVLPTSLVNHTSLTRTTSLTPNTTNKETHIKEIHTNTGPASEQNSRVRVVSRFSLAECRRYAESLRSEGVKNPGGYATKIHRSGEADELIATFLKPVESAKPVDGSQCPDCHGTGFWEPGGTGKGVARCTHTKLKKDDLEQ